MFYRLCVSQQYFPESSLQLENGQQNLTEGNPSRMSFSESGAVGKVASESRTTWKPQTLRKPKEALRKQHWQLTILKRHEFFSVPKRRSWLTADDSQNCQTEAESYWLGSTSQKSRGQKKRRFRIIGIPNVTSSCWWRASLVGWSPSNVFDVWNIFGESRWHFSSRLLGTKNTWTFPGFLDTAGRILPVERPVGLFRESVSPSMEFAEDFCWNLDSLFF